MRSLVSKPDAAETKEELGMLPNQKLLVQIRIRGDVALDHNYDAVSSVLKYGYLY